MLVLTIQKEEIFTNQILNESDTNKFDYNHYVNYKCSKNERTLLHLVCESGCFKFINECFVCCPNKKEVSVLLISCYAVFLHFPPHCIKIPIPRNPLHDWKKEDLKILRLTKYITRFSN